MVAAFFKKKVKIKGKNMHYFKWRISDYASHTQHLDEIEDLAYRRMLDWYYLHESHLPNSVEQIARLIRMRTHCEAIANVLQEFFELDEYGYFQKSADREIQAYKSKSEKAKASAKARWDSRPVKSDANALRNECEGNANHKPLTINHKPITNNQKTKDNGRAKRFVPPSIDEVLIYCTERKNNVNAHEFVNHYEANGWMRGKTKIKDWKACVRTWEQKNKNNSGAVKQRRLLSDVIAEQRGAQHGI